MKTIQHPIVYIIIAIVFFLIIYALFKHKSINIEKEKVVSPIPTKAKVVKGLQKGPGEGKKEKGKEISKVAVATSELPFTEKALEEKLHDENPYRQSEGIAMLELKGGEESVRKLEELFMSPTPAVIMEAVSAVGRMGAREAVESLENLYEKSRVRIDGYGQSIRSEIIVALGNIRDEKAVPLLGKEFKSNEGLMYNDLLLDALEKIGSKQSLPYLEEYLKFLKDNPGPEDFEALRFLVNESMKNTERIINEIKNTKNKE